MEFKERTLTQIADMICGNFETGETFFRYRSSSYLTEFFKDCETDYRHDGSTRKWWVAETLRQILGEPQPFSKYTTRHVRPRYPHADGSGRFDQRRSRKTWGARAPEYGARS